MRMKEVIYLNEVLREIPRLISQLNRNPISENYGCFDRQYWHYNTVDFPCARMQEAVLTLALLYKIKHEGNPYYNKKILYEWINAALHYWLRIQNENGSFNEWYPKENSFVATAFSSYAISETLIYLGRNKINSSDEIISGLINAGKWVSKKREARAVNQEIGAAAALYNIYLLTNDDFFKKRYMEKIEFVTDEQKNEGWFSEYGGADIGYLSLSIYYLARIYKKTNDNRILNLLSNATSFIKYFIHPDGSAGGLYGSRNTEYLIPDGFEILSKYIPDAALISESIRDSLEKGSIIGPSKLDDRYLMYTGYTFIQAYLDSNENEVRGNTEIPYKREFVKDFPIAGLWIYSDPYIYLIVNYRKGGVYRLFFKERNISIGDAGLLIYTKESKYASGWLSDGNCIVYKDGKIIVKGRLSKIPDKVLSPMENILLRTFQLTFGKSQMISQHVKEKLRDILITENISTRYKFTREICVREKCVYISDLIDFIDLIEGELYVNCNTHLIYTPSSRYFLPWELNSFQESIRLKHKKIKIERIFDKKTGNQISFNVIKI